MTSSKTKPVKLTAEDLEEIRKMCGHSLPVSDWPHDWEILRKEYQRLNVDLSQKRRQP